MINCIVALEKNQGIGFENSMPWPRLTEDLRWFKQLTTDHIVIMGANTWYSLKKPLPNRVNIVLSKSVKLDADYTFDNVKESLEICSTKFPEKKIFIIGGQAVYDSTMHLVDKFYVTEIDTSYICDKYFDLNYVRKNFRNVIEHGTFSVPVPFKIKEYTNAT